MNEADLVGTWRLEAYHDLDDAGVRSEGPLGQDPRGKLTYTADGQVSVHMMRTSGSASAAGSNDYMGYAGTWRVAGTDVVHTIEVLPKSAWLGTEQVRSAQLEEDRLTLHGSVKVNGREQRRVLVWRRD